MMLLRHCARACRTATCRPLMTATPDFGSLAVADAGAMLSSLPEITEADATLSAAAAAGELPPRAVVMLLERALEICAGATGPSSELSRAAALRLTEVCATLGDWERARHHLQSSHAFGNGGVPLGDARHIDVELALAHCSLMLADGAESAARARAAADACARDSDAPDMIALGRSAVYEGLGALVLADFDTAEDSLYRAARLAPDDDLAAHARALTVLGGMHLARSAGADEDEDEALSTWAEAVKLAPSAGGAAAGSSSSMSELLGVRSLACDAPASQSEPPAETPEATLAAAACQAHIAEVMLRRHARRHGAPVSVKPEGGDLLNDANEQLERALKAQTALLPPLAGADAVTARVAWPVARTLSLLAEVRRRVGSSPAPGKLRRVRHVPPSLGARLRRRRCTTSRDAPSHRRASIVPRSMASRPRRPCRRLRRTSRTSSAGRRARTAGCSPTGMRANWRRASTPRRPSTSQLDCRGRLSRRPRVAGCRLMLRWVSRKKNGGVACVRRGFIARQRSDGARHTQAILLKRII